MKPIKFNSNCKSNSYTSHFEYLESDYSLFRDKYFSHKCLDWLKEAYGSSLLKLTHSATAGLEMIARLIDLKVGDEVIMPSFTFVSSANAFAGVGAIPVFVDLEMESLNLDVNLVEEAITTNTKAIVAMHYIGHACDLDHLRKICDQHGLFLIEDAAMGFGASFNEKPLGTIGDFGVISFDITKQISAIQGGLLLVNNQKFASKANQIYHNGTNRIAYENGDVPYYEWVSLGSKYQMNELNSAFLYEQLINSEIILNHRKQLSAWYYEKLQEIEKQGHFRLMGSKNIPNNVHAFYLLFGSKSARVEMQKYFEDNYVEAFFHYSPLHLSSFGLKVGRYIGGNNTEFVSDSLLRLPFHSGISYEEVEQISSLINQFYHGK